MSDVLKTPPAGKPHASRKLFGALRVGEAPPSAGGNAKDPADTETDTNTEGAAVGASRDAQASEANPAYPAAAVSSGAAAAF
jgi:hypothetical protein